MENTISKNSIYLHIIHGEKGGVGKSTVAIALIEYLRKSGSLVKILDADMANPDVARFYNAILDIQRADFRAAEGWMDFTDFLIAAPGGSHVVISLPAGVGQELCESLPKHLEKFKSSGINVKTTIWWVLSRTIDSIMLLDSTLKSLHDSVEKFNVILNGFFGKRESFVRWNESQLALANSKKNTFEIFYFPALHDRVIDKLNGEGGVGIMPWREHLTGDIRVQAVGSTLTPSERVILEDFFISADAAFDAAKM